jgi:toxin ParE1/3/4
MMFGQFPKLGHVGEVPETREFAVTGLPYLIVYSITRDGGIDILTIIHARRRYPPMS